MQESFHITLNGQRVGVILDRKRKQVHVNQPGSKFNGIKTTDIDGETYEINYSPEPQSTPHSDEFMDYQPYPCSCGGAGSDLCTCNQNVNYSNLKKDDIFDPIEVIKIGKNIISPLSNDTKNKVVKEIISDLKIVQLKISDMEIDFEGFHTISLQIFYLLQILHERTRRW